MGKKKSENEKAESGSGKQHDKQGEKKGPKKAHKRAEPGSGEQHNKQTAAEDMDNEISTDSDESETDD